MSRCRRTDALLMAVFAGDGLSAAQDAHGAACPECARALALARRFDGELHRVSGDLVTQPMATTQSKGGRDMWRGALLAGTVVAVIALVISSIQVWRDGQTVGFFEAGGLSAEQLSAWLDSSLVIAHGQAQPGGTAIDGWEAERVEVCGDTAIAFFDRGGDGSHGYLWAIGRPSGLPDESIETGWSRSRSATDVARRRAELPVCDVALEGAPNPVGADLPLASHVVVRVPDLFWVGDPEDAPVEVEVVGDLDAVVEVGIARDAYLHARLEDPSIRAVDIVSADARYRYTVGAPGFTVWANVVDDVVMFELLNEDGDIVRAGPIVDWPDDQALGRDRERAEAAAARQAAETARRAAAERRAGEALASGQTCRDWRALGAESQVLLAEELTVDRVEAVRTAQQLGAAASFTEIATAAQASIDKSCQGSPAGRFLTEIVEALYPGE